MVDLGGVFQAPLCLDYSETLRNTSEENLGPKLCNYEAMSETIKLTLPILTGIATACACLFDHWPSNHLFVLQQQCTAGSIALTSTALLFSGIARGTPRAGGNGEGSSDTLNCEVEKSRNGFSELNLWTPEGFVCCYSLYRVLFQKETCCHRRIQSAETDKYRLLKPKVYRYHVTHRNSSV